jgi:hypothetical protein
MGYTTLVNRIVEIARKRWEPTPFLKELQKNRTERAKARKQAAKLAQSSETAPVKEKTKENIEKPDE